MLTNLIKLFRHFPDDLRILHVPKHLGAHRTYNKHTHSIRQNIHFNYVNLFTPREHTHTFTARAVDKEVDELQQGRVSVHLIRLNPVINH